MVPEFVSYTSEAVLNTRFTLVRHAESLWNAAGRWQGHGDPPLSERGFSQALACAERFAEAGEHVDLLICSDLLRTRQTAGAIGESLGLTPRPTSQLRELAIGRWTGMTREEIGKTEGDLLERFDSGDPDVRPGDGETRNEIRHRVRNAVESFGLENPGKHLVLVVHAGVIRALVPNANPKNTESVGITLAEIRDARPEVHPHAPAVRYPNSDVQY